jgi:hypothetical protein
VSIRRQPEVALRHNPPVVRRAAEWPEAQPTPTPRPGQQGSAGRSQPPALAQAQAPRALPTQVKATTPGRSAGAEPASPAGLVAPSAAANRVVLGPHFQHQQLVQWPNQGPPPAEPAAAGASSPQRPTPDTAQAVSTSPPVAASASRIVAHVDRELASATSRGELEGFPARMAKAILDTDPKPEPHEVWLAIGKLVMRRGEHAQVGYHLRELAGYDIVDPELGDAVRSPLEWQPAPDTPQATHQPNQAPLLPGRAAAASASAMPELQSRRLPDQESIPLPIRSLEDLDEQLGPSVSARVIEAAADGLRGEQGIPAIGQSLREAAGGRALLPQQLLRVAAVLFNLSGEMLGGESFPLAIHDLEHLAGRAGMGVYPTTLSGENLLDAVGSYPDRQLGWAHDVANAIRNGEGLQAQPGLTRWFGMNMFDNQALRYWKTQLQLLFDGQLLPWGSTRSEGLLDAWARLHAVAASLALVPGMNLRGLNNEHASWGELVRRGPAVERLDLAVVYPEVYEFLLNELRSMRQRPAAEGAVPAPAERFAQSRRLDRLYGALFPAGAPAGLRDALLQAVQRRASSGEVAAVAAPQDPVARNAALHAAARAIALDPDFFLVGGRLRTELALEAFQGWLSQAARTDPGMVIGDAPLSTQSVDRIVARLRDSADPLAAMRRLLARSGLAAQADVPLDFHTELPAAQHRG